MPTRIFQCIMLIASLMFAIPAHAVTVTWADLTSAAAGKVYGNIDDIGVTYSGGYAFAQTNGGTDFWRDSGYTQGKINRPTGTDLISLSTVSQRTITFSQPVSNPYIAFVSWNENSATFSTPFTLVSQGAGFWGSGTFSTKSATKFSTVGEFHGILMFPGTFTSLSFIETNGENWHGITVGLETPIPAALPLFASALGGMGLLGVRRNRKILPSA